MNTNCATSKERGVPSVCTTCSHVTRKGKVHTQRENSSSDPFLYAGQLKETIPGTGRATGKTIILLHAERFKRQMEHTVKL